jgi:hypothetical protein
VIFQERHNLTPSRGNASRPQFVVVLVTASQTLVTGQVAHGHKPDLRVSLRQLGDRPDVSVVRHNDFKLRCVALPAQSFQASPQVGAVIRGVRSVAHHGYDDGQNRGKSFV